jgi:hypothetical protein
MSLRARRCRCIRKRSASPATTTSTSTSWPPTGPPARAASSGRSSSSATTCCPAGPSPPSRTWTPPSPPGSRSDGPRPTGLTSRSSASGRPATTWPSSRCQRLRIWWLNGICGRSARTAWSPSAATSTRCPPAGSAPGSWWRSGPRSRRSCCIPPSPAPAARHCWPLILGRSAAGSASSKTPTGTACPRARDAGPPPAMSCHSPAVSVLGARRQGRCRLC